MCPRLNCAIPILKKGSCCKLYCLDSLESLYFFTNEINKNFSSLTPSCKYSALICLYLVLVIYNFKLLVIENHSNLTTNIIICILSALVLILLLLVIMLLLKSIHKRTSKQSNGNCRLLASSFVTNSNKNKNLNYSAENASNMENNFLSQKNKFNSFNRIESNNLNISQNRNSHYFTRDIQSPLLKNDYKVNAHQQINNSESESFSNDENSKSTLFTCSIDDSNLKSSLILNKQNPMSTAIYYC